MNVPIPTVPSVPHLSQTVLANGVEKIRLGHFACAAVFFLICPSGYLYTLQGLSSLSLLLPGKLFW